MAGDYQIVEIHRLNEILKKHGIHDKEARQRICEEHAACFGTFLDQGWFEGEHEKVSPMIVFAQREPWTEDKAGAVKEVFFPEATSMIYEGYSESIDWYFVEHQEQLEPEIEIGLE